MQLQPKLIEPLYESKPDIEIYTLLARRMGLGEFFQKSDVEYIELLLSSGHPSLEGITLEKLKEGPIKPKHLHGATIFYTPHGRIEFYVEKLVPFGQALPVYIEPWESARQPLAQKYPLCFMQEHTKYFQHSLYGNVDWMREVMPEPTLKINPVDAEKRGIRDGDMVVAVNDRGRLKVKARLNEGIKPGVVSVMEGFWPRDYAEGCYNDLTDLQLNPAQQAAFETQAQMQGVLVEVKKAEE